LRLQKILQFLRPALVLVVIFLALGFVIIGYQTVRTLQQLTAIEAERDRWQRQSDIIRALNLRQGSTVVDLGCGSGYFALKLSQAIGSQGTVVAVDIRRLPLRILWLRALVRNQRNIRSVLSEPDDPHLSPNAADAVLVVNTYHELESPEAILDHIFRSLVSGGSLVIVDPVQTENGRLAATNIETKLRTAGFEISARDDEFLTQPGRGSWLLIAARKP